MTTIYELGQTYYCRYLDFNIDPAPYLYVTYADRRIVKGWNLHYLPNIRFNIKIESYKMVTQPSWKKAYENMKRIGMFRGFTDILDLYSDGGYSMARFKSLVDLVSNKHPWAMKAFRHYHTGKLRTIQ